MRVSHYFNHYFFHNHYFLTRYRPRYYARVYQLTTTEVAYLWLHDKRKTERLSIEQELRSLHEIKCASKLITRNLYPSFKINSERILIYVYFSFDQKTELIWIMIYTFVFLFIITIRENWNSRSTRFRGQCQWHWVLDRKRYRSLGENILQHRAGISSFSWGVGDLNWNVEGIDFC